MSKAQEIIDKIEKLRKIQTFPMLSLTDCSMKWCLFNKEPEAWDLCTDRVRFLLNERFCYTGPSSYGSYR